MVFPLLAGAVSLPKRPTSRRREAVSRRTSRRRRSGAARRRAGGPSALATLPLGPTRRSRRAAWRRTVGWARAPDRRSARPGAAPTPHVASAEALAGSRGNEGIGG